VLVLERFFVLDFRRPSERSVTTQQLHVVVDTVVSIDGQTTNLLEGPIREPNATTTSFGAPRSETEASACKSASVFVDFHG